MALEPQPAAVTVVAGFLGAGKTTLLNRLVQGLAGVPSAVVVNDFGRVVIDAAQVVGVEDGVIQLTEGCICCTMRNGITSTLLALLERRPAPRHVLVETSGIADPRAVALPILELQRLGGVRLDGVISVVDAEGFAAPGDGLDAAQRQLLDAQVRAADVVVLNKIDLVTPERVAAVHAAIRRLVPTARVLEAVEADVPIDLLLAVESDTRRLEGVPVLELCVHDAGEGHAHGFATHSHRTERPLSWAKLVPVLQSLAPAVYRVKGLLHLAERGGDRLLLHVVGRRIYVRTIEPWGAEPPRSELVLIGRAGGFSAREIDEALAACAE